MYDPGINGDFPDFVETDSESCRSAQCMFPYFINFSIQYCYTAFHARWVGLLQKQPVCKEKFVAIFSLQFQRITDIELNHPNYY